jgi:PAS domain S-box-containing protein
MKGQPGPSGRHAAARLPRRYLAAAVTIGLFAALLSSELPPPARRAVSGIGLVGGALALGTVCFLRFRRTTGRRRLAWLLFSVACLPAAAGNLALWMGGATSGDPASPANILVTVALLIGVAAVAIYPAAPRRSTELARMALDGLVIGGSLLYIASLTLFPRMLNGTEHASGRLLPLLVPVVDLIVATVAGLLSWRASSADRPSLVLASVGFGLYAVSDFAFALITAQGGFTLGTITDLGWIAGYVILTLAISLSRPVGRTEIPRELSPVLGTVLIFGLFLVAALAGLFWNDSASHVPARALWLTVLIGVAGRQVVLIVDNERLRRSLEQRVAARTGELRQSIQQTALLVNSVGEGIYGVDREGLITFVNPAATRVLGYAQRELIGRSAHEMIHAPLLDGTPHPVETCYVTEAIRDRRVTSAEEDVYTRADGLQIPVEVTATPLAEEDQVRGAVVVFRDVTQRREVDRMKREFVSMVSHELRTPLTAIRGALGLLAGGALGTLTPNAGRMVHIGVESSERLTRLINDILDVERIEAGVVAMDPGYHTSAELVDQAVAQVNVLAEQAGIRIAVDDLEGFVYADPDRAVQTLINLLGNAIKFSPAGTTVTVETLEHTAFVEFAVQDRGRGLPADKLESIFSRFEQVDSSDARANGGSGLGLAISRGLVERLGGRIWAENNFEGGATFHFTLPSSQPRMTSAVASPLGQDRPPLVAQRAETDAAVIEDPTSVATR